MSSVSIGSDDAHFDCKKRVVSSGEKSSKMANTASGSKGTSTLVISTATVRNWVDDDRTYNKFRGTLKGKASRVRQALQLFDFDKETPDKLQWIKDQAHVISTGQQYLEMALTAYLDALQDAGQPKTFLQTVKDESLVYIEDYRKENEAVIDSIRTFEQRIRILPTTTASSTVGSGIITVQSNPSTTGTLTVIPGAGTLPLVRDVAKEQDLEGQISALVVDVDSYLDMVKKATYSYGSKSGMIRRFGKAQDLVKQIRALNLEYRKILPDEYKHLADNVSRNILTTMEDAEDLLNDHLNSRQGEAISDVTSVSTNASTVRKVQRTDYLTQRALEEAQAAAARLLTHAKQTVNNVSLLQGGNIGPCAGPKKVVTFPPPRMPRLLQTNVNNYPAMNHRLPASTNQPRLQVNRTNVDDVANLNDLEDVKPDGENWISYLNVEDEPVPWYPGFKSSIHTKLTVFDGDLVNYRGWRSLFFDMVHNTPMQIGEKISALQESLTPTVRQFIGALTGGKKDYVKALKMLDRKYGDRHKLKQAYLHALRAVDGPGRNAEALEVFANKTCGLMTVLDNCGVIDARSIIDEHLEKLVEDYAADWRKHARQLGDDVTLWDFTAWLMDFAGDRKNWNTANKAKSSKKEAEKTNSKVNHSKGSQGLKLNASSTNTTPTGDTTKEEKCGLCEISGHVLKSCRKFAKMTAEDRLTSMKKMNPWRCFACLEPKHYWTSKSCPAKQKPCGKDGCEKVHHQLLHLTFAKKSTPTTQTVEDGNNQAVANNSTAMAMSMVRGVQVSFGVLVGTVKIGNRETRANVALDNMSDCCFITEKFRAKAGLKLGRKITATVTGIGGAAQEIATHEVKLPLTPTQPGSRSVTVTAWTLPQLTGKITKIDWTKEKKRFEHLADLPMVQLMPGETPDILLGMDFSDQHIPEEVRRGQPGEPYAEKTALGWVIRGRVPGTTISGPIKMATNFASAKFELSDLAEKFFEAEAFGTEHKSGYKTKEDVIWEHIRHGITKLEGPGYQVKLPWREDVPRPADNRKDAEKRLDTLLRKLEKDPKELDDYHLAMNKYLDEGYASVAYTYDHKKEPTANDPRLAEGQFFLPHHAVRKRSTKKLRIVFDAAAQKNGRSLNDCLYEGRKLQLDITEVMLRFREREVAFMGDVEAMFSRVRLNQEDASYQQFLWRLPKEEKTQVLRMNRLMFGATCSPCLAIATIHRTAQDFGSDQPEATETILKGMYVDDLLESVQEVETANERIKEVTCILRNGDFNLRDFRSNCPEFNTGMEVPMDQEKVAGVLGMKWDLEEDSLFHVNAEEFKGKFTKRELLGALASFYSPLGLVSPFIVAAKVNLKLLHLFGMDWDDDLEGKIELPYVEQLTFWKQWLNLRDKVCMMKFPRCLAPGKPIRIELHAFGDASIEALAAVVYIKSEYVDGNINLRIAIAKTMVAPKKTLSVAKLELQAALKAARLARTFTEATRLPLDRRWLWTDSGCTRQWIRAASALVKTFVGNRIGGLHEALIRSAKRALYFVVGTVGLKAKGALRSGYSKDPSPNRKLPTDGELRVLFAEVTAFLNSRPLVYVSADPNDGVLTPNDFLAPKAHFASPPGVQDASSYGDSYERVQHLVNEAWKVWTREYLPALTTRSKWQTAQRNATVGDLVLLVEPNLPRGVWKTGNVVETIIGKGGFVRSVMVETGDGIHHRPITRCCLLKAVDDRVSDEQEEEKNEDLKTLSDAED